MKRMIAALAGLSMIAAVAWTLRPSAATLAGTVSISRNANGSGDMADSRSSSFRPVGKLPLGFEPNVGQTDQQVSFISHGQGFTVFLTTGEAVLSIKRPSAHGQDALRPLSLASQPASHADVLSIDVLGANPEARIAGLDRLAGISNYFIGDDPTAWHAGIPTFRRVLYEEVYPGIDLTYYGDEGGQLEYDFTVAPGGDPAMIGLGFQGQQGLSLDADGALVLRMPDGLVRQPSPFAYQAIDGAQHAVPISYDIQRGVVRFVLGSYDASRPLVIDPKVVYSTFLGGTDFDAGADVAVDRFGNAYVFGHTFSTDFPVADGAFQPESNGSLDAFVTKLNARGSDVIYSTYLGGGDEDEAFGLSIDRAGDAFVAGPTLSTDFPTTPGAFQPDAPGGDHDGYVTKLDPTGSALVYSTYLGGSAHDAALTPVVDPAGNVYVIGDTNSDDLPVTADAFQKHPSGGDCLIFEAFDPGDCEEEGGLDTFVAKLNPAGSDVLYLTYLGASGDEVGIGLDIDRRGHTYVALESDSTDFPVTPHAYQPTFAGGDGSGFDAAPTDNVIVKLNPTGSRLVYSTYLGGSGDECDVFQCYLTVDRNGHAFLGSETSSTDFPTTKKAYQTTNHGGYDDTITKLSRAGTHLIYSTYLGGTSDDDVVNARNIAVDGKGNAYVAGWTLSMDFPLEDPIQASNAGDWDITLSKLDDEGSELLFSTYLGSSGFDGAAMALGRSGAVYLAGLTCAADYRTTPGAFQPAFGGGDCDAMVTKVRVGDDEAPGRLHRGPLLPGDQSTFSPRRWRSP